MRIKYVAPLVVLGVLLGWQIVLSLTNHARQTVLACYHESPVFEPTRAPPGNLITKIDVFNDKAFTDAFPSVAKIMGCLNSESQSTDTEEQNKVRVGNSVGRLSLQYLVEGRTITMFCTASVVGPKLILTANHCIPGWNLRGDPPKELQRARLYMGYEIEGGQTNVKTYEVNKRPIPSNAGDINSDAAKDFSLVNIIPGQAGDGVDPAREGFAPLPLDSIENPAEKTVLYVVHHPWGYPKRFFSHCLVLPNKRLTQIGLTPGAFFAEDCDTADGSSGAPLFTVTAAGSSRLVGILSSSAVTDDKGNLLPKDTPYDVLAPGFMSFDVAARANVIFDGSKTLQQLAQGSPISTNLDQKQPNLDQRPPPFTRADVSDLPNGQAILASQEARMNGLRYTSTPADPWADLPGLGWPTPKYTSDVYLQSSEVVAPDGKRTTSYENAFRSNIELVGSGARWITDDSTKTIEYAATGIIKYTELARCKSTDTMAGRLRLQSECIIKSSNIGSGGTPARQSLRELQEVQSVRACADSGTVAGPLKCPGGDANIPSFNTPSIAIDFNDCLEDRLGERHCADRRFNIRLVAKGIDDPFFGKVDTYEETWRLYGEYESTKTLTFSPTLGAVVRMEQTQHQDGKTIINRSDMVSCSGNPACKVDAERAARIRTIENNYESHH